MRASRSQPQLMQLMKLTFIYCAMMRRPFDQSFIKSNIRASFEKTGIWPFDLTRLLSVPRPRAADEIDTILSVEELHALFEEKRQEARFSIVGHDTRIDTTCFISTTCGVVFTSDRALQLAGDKSEANRRK